MLQQSPEALANVGAGMITESGDVAARCADERRAPSGDTYMLRGQSAALRQAAQDVQTGGWHEPERAGDDMDAERPFARAEQAQDRNTARPRAPPPYARLGGHIVYIQQPA
jgi:hypothetical protein